MRMIPFLAVLACAPTLVRAAASSSIDCSDMASYNSADVLNLLRAASEGRGSAVDSQRKLIECAKAADKRNTQLASQVDQVRLKAANQGLQEMGYQKKILDTDVRRSINDIANSSTLKLKMEDALNEDPAKRAEMQKFLQQASAYLASTTNGVKPDEMSTKLALPGSPFVVIAKFSSGDDKKPVMHFEIEVGNENEFSDEARKLGPEKLKKLLEPINAELRKSGGENFQIPADLMKDPEHMDKDKLRDFAAGVVSSATKRAFVDSEGSARKAVASLEDNFNPSSSSSEAAKLNRRVEEAGGSPSRIQEMRKLDLTSAVANWLRRNDPTGLSTCEIYEKALPADAIWPDDAEEECANPSEEEDAPTLRKKDAKGGDKADALKKKKKGEDDGDDDKESFDKKLKVLDEKRTKDFEEKSKDLASNFEAIAQYCLSMYRNQAAQSGMKSIVDTVGPAWQQMLKQGMTSKMFAEMIGDVVTGDMTLDADSPVRAGRIVRSVPLTKEGYDELLQERESVGKILKISGNLLAQLAASSPLGLMDPALQMDPKVQQLMAYHKAATTLNRSITDEINNRGPYGNPYNNGRLAPLSVPVIGNGSSTNGVRPADRRQILNNNTGPVRPADAARDRANSVPVNRAGRPNLLN